MPHSAYLVKGYRPGSFEAQMISKPSVKFGQSGKFPAVPSGVRRVSLFSQVLLLLLVILRQPWPLRLLLLPLVRLYQDEVHFCKDE